MSLRQDTKVQEAPFAEIFVSNGAVIEDVLPVHAALWGRAARDFLGLEVSEAFQNQPALLKALRELNVGQTYWDPHSAILLRRDRAGFRLTVLLPQAAAPQDVIYLLGAQNQILWQSNGAEGLVPQSLSEVVGTVDCLLLEVELARTRSQTDRRRVRLRESLGGYVWADLFPIQEGGLILMDLRGAQEGEAGFSTLDVMEAAQSLAQIGSWYLKANGAFEASKSMEVLIGWPETLSPLQASDLLDHLHVADHETYTQAVWGCVTHQTPYDLQLMHLRSDGSEFLARLRGRAQLSPEGIMLGVIGVVEDISPLLASEARISALADNFPEGAVFRRTEAQKDFPFTYASRGVVSLLGLTQADLLDTQRSLEAQIVPEERAAYLERWEEAFRTHNAFEITCKMINVRSLQAHWVRISATPIFEAGAWHWDGVMIDVTGERKLLEELTQAKEVAETAEALKSKFVAMMGHELRAPLSTIAGMTRQLRRTKLAAPQRRFLGHLEEATQNLLTVLNELLDFSKLSAGGFRLRLENFELDALLAHVAAGTSVRAAEKGLELVFVLDPQLPRRLYGDVLALGQVLINLVANAVKFTEQGQITLRILRNPKTGRLRCMVSDTGPGISEEMQARLFQAYEQEADTPHFSGTGLGLVICRELVAEMGGQISVESQIGKGTIFSVDLPLPEVQDEARPQVNLAGRSGVIVSASPDVRQGLLWQLDQSKGIARVFATAEQVLQTLDLEKVQFAILDVPTGQPDALERLRNLCANLPLHTQVFLLVSPLMDASLEAFAAEFSVAGVLSKPVSRHVLAERLAQSFEGGGKEDLVSEVSSLKPKGFGGKSVLLVDDDALSTEVIADMLGDLGVRSEIVNDGRKALTMVTERRFDAVFLDLRMPIMNGYEAIRLLRENPALRHLAVFAMTAEDRHGTQSELLGLGFDAVLMKPLDEVMLYDVLTRFWGKRSYQFDYQKILARFSGNERRANSTIELFVRDFEARSREVLDPLTSRERLGRIVHSVKGTAAYVQAEHLESLAMTLHRYLEFEETEGDLDFERLVSDFTAEFIWVIDVLKAYVEEKGLAKH